MGLNLKELQEARWQVPKHLGGYLGSAVKNISSPLVSWGIIMKAQVCLTLSLPHTLCALRPPSFCGKPLPYSQLELQVAPILL